ncbi:MAG: energy transducer TonB, partial [Micavibrio aeruginosavorus]
IKERWSEMPSEMKVPIIVSAIAHGALVILAITGLPFFYNKPPETMSTAIPIEILPIGEMTTSNKPPVKAQKPAEKPPETKPKAPAPPKVEAVEPPKETPKPPEPPKPAEPPKEKAKPVTPPPPEEKLETPKEKAEPKPAEKPKPKEDPKPKEQPKEKPKEEKAVTQEQQQNFDSLLKNLQDGQEVVDETLPESKTPDAASPSADAPFSENLTMSELDALRQQLSRCWSVQAGARYAENLAVEVRMIVSPDRKVLSATVVDQWRYGQDSYFRAAADSAIRAVNSPQCETLNLNPDKYNLWKDIVVTFDPRDML